MNRPQKPQWTTTGEALKSQSPLKICDRSCCHWHPLLTFQNKENKFLCRMKLLFSSWNVYLLGNTISTGYLTKNKLLCPQRAKKGLENHSEKEEQCLSWLKRFLSRLMSIKWIIDAWNWQSNWRSLPWFKDFQSVQFNQLSANVCQKNYNLTK